MIKTSVWFFKFFTGLANARFKLSKVKKMIVKGDEEKASRLAFETAKGWSKNMVENAGGDIEVIGHDHIPAGPVLFVANHQGNFDIPILLGFIDKPKGFIAKIELKKFPLINEWMEYIDCIFMDRSSVRQSLKAIKEGVGKLEDGKSLVIFPEGTRSRDGKLREFKAGSLKLATKSGVPIVPVAIDGSVDMMEKKKVIIKPAKVRLVISKPIYTKDIDREREKNLHLEVRDIIEKNLAKHQ